MADLSKLKNDLSVVLRNQAEVKELSEQNGIKFMAAAEMLSESLAEGMAKGIEKVATEMRRGNQMRDADIVTALQSVSNMDFQVKFAPSQLESALTASLQKAAKDSKNNPVTYDVTVERDNRGRMTGAKVTPI